MAAEPAAAWHASLHFPATSELREAGICLGAASLAARSGDACLLGTLLHATADCINERDVEDCYTPLHWACCFGHEDCVRLLLEVREAAAAGVSRVRSDSLRSAAPVRMRAALRAGRRRRWLRARAFPRAWSCALRAAGTPLCEMTAAGRRFTAPAGTATRCA